MEEFENDCSDPTPIPAANAKLVLTPADRCPARKVYGPSPEAGLLQQWFAPLPWTITEASSTSGRRHQPLCHALARGRNSIPNQGVYLEVVPNEKIVVTDAFTKPGSRPKSPFMTAVMTFENEAGKTPLLPGHGAPLERRGPAMP